MAEDGELPGIVKTNELRREAASGISRMRANAGGNVLGGPTDPRSRIEAALGATNIQLAEAKRRIGGVSREPVTQTSAGQRILADLAGEVGHILRPSATATVETTAPAVETKSSSIINTIKDFFRK